MAILNKIKKSTVIKNSLIYTIFNFINKGIPFLLIPILTKYLNQEDYGIISIFNTYVQALFLIIGLSLVSSISVNFFHLDNKDFKIYVSNTLFILILTFIVSIFVTYILEDYLIKFIKLSSEWVYLSLITAFFMLINEITLTLWRLNEEAIKFAYYSIVITLFNITISLILIISLSYNWEGRTLGITSSTILFGIVSFIILKYKGFIFLKLNTNFIIDALKLGLATIPHHIALMLRTGADIFMITYILGLSAVGVYSIGYQFGGIFGIIMGGINTAFSVYHMKILKNSDEQKRIMIVKYTYIGIIILFLSSIIFSLILEFLFSIMVNEKFNEAKQYIFIITVAHSFQGMYFMMVNYLYFKKKNHIVSVISIISVTTQIILSYMLIKIYGAMGAAYATFFGFLLTFLLVFYTANKIYPMPWFNKKGIS